MSNNIYKSRKMYQSPLALLLIIPIGALIFFFCYDVVVKAINQQIINKDCKTVLKYLMDKEGTYTDEEYKFAAREKFKEMGYKDTKNISVYVNSDEEFILTMYRHYTNVEVYIKTFDLATVKATVKGTYNEYKEPVIEIIDINRENSAYIEEMT